jgi:hypothetical protein
MVIVEQVFGIVKRNNPQRSGGWVGGDLGCRGKGQQPLCPCFLDVEEYAIRFSASGVTVLSGFFADSVFSTENIAPGSLTSDDP